MHASALALLLVAVAGCVSEPEPFPTEKALKVPAIEEDGIPTVDREAQPPLYQLLYDAPLLPESQEVQQRVRLLVWLRHMELSVAQLDRLKELRGLAVNRHDRLDKARQDLVERYEPDEDKVYEGLWRGLSAGVPIDAPEMADTIDKLRELRGGGQRERELISLQLEGIRSIIEAERPFLNSLTPRQEGLLTDSLFLLRHVLDPVGNPGDFRALAGTVYEPGQYAVLTRGTGEVSRDPLNIGALWSDEPMLQGHELHDARREVLLFLALLEPGFEEALAAARTLADKGVPGSSQPAPEVEVQPPVAPTQQGGPIPFGQPPGVPPPAGGTPPPSGEGSMPSRQPPGGQRAPPQ